MDQSVNNSRNAIADTKKTLAAAKAQSQEISRGLADLSKAMEKCRAYSAEHALAEQRTAALRIERRTLLADSAIGEGDGTALAKNDRDLKAAEAKELTSIAEDGRVAVAELEVRYAAAVAPLKAIGVEISHHNCVLLEQAAMILLATYGEKICEAYDLYLEILAIVRARNVHAVAAGQAPIPDMPSGIEFPAVPLGDWRMRNTIHGGKPEQLEQALERAEKKIAELGIS